MIKNIILIILLSISTWVLAWFAGGDLAKLVTMGDSNHLLAFVQEIILIILIGDKINRIELETPKKRTAWEGF